MKKHRKPKKQTAQKHKAQSVRHSKRKIILITCLSVVTGLIAYGAVSFALMPREEHSEQNTTKKYSDYKIEIPQDTPGSEQVPESTPESTSSNQQSSASTNSSSSNLTQWDSDGCQIGSSSYQICRQNVFNAQCDTKHNTAYSAYHASYNPVRASYDTDINAMKQELNDLVSRGVYTSGQAAGIMNDYRHQRTQPFNAAVTPIYSTYTSAVDSLNATGCKLYKYAIANPTLPF